ncbi:hypothetical protein PR048_018083 [Dryococelus australis]|uniref:Uncharacterized protein n=1 Tax=Dryococelus australis TaxID=614101 RepID=A0ABQ9HB91_9NEOP|nr:hypothetical protein PR048_018083 [Dryococelus australis]
MFSFTRIKRTHFRRGLMSVFKTAITLQNVHPQGNSEPMSVIEVNMERRRNEGTGKREIPEKAHRHTASSGTIPTCGNPMTWPGIEPGSPWWEASVLIAQPPWPLDVQWEQVPTNCLRLPTGTPPHIAGINTHQKGRFTRHNTPCELMLGCFACLRPRSVGALGRSMYSPGMSGRLYVQGTEEREDEQSCVDYPRLDVRRRTTPPCCECSVASRSKQTGRQSQHCLPQADVAQHGAVHDTSSVCRTHASSRLTGHRSEANTTPVTLLMFPTKSHKDNLVTSHDRCRGCGGVTVRLLGEPDYNPAEIAPKFPHVEIVPDDTACWSASFLGFLSPVSPALAFRRCSILTSFHPHRLSRPRWLSEVSMEQRRNARAGETGDSHMRKPGVSLPGIEPRPASLRHASVLHHFANTVLMATGWLASSWSVCFPSWRSIASAEADFSNTLTCGSLTSSEPALSTAYYPSRVDAANRRRHARVGKREIAEETHRPAASSGTIPRCENPGAPPPGIESGSPRRVPPGAVVFRLSSFRSRLFPSQRVESRSSKMSLGYFISHSQDNLVHEMLTKTRTLALNAQLLAIYGYFTLFEALLKFYLQDIPPPRVDND